MPRLNSGTPNATAIQIWDFIRIRLFFRIQYDASGSIFGVQYTRRTAVHIDFLPKSAAESQPRDLQCAGRTPRAD
jgi:hypothetical protein